MCKYIRFLGIGFLFMALVILALGPQPVLAASATEIDRDVDSALKKLYARSPQAKELSKKAKGILVFPNIIKGGFLLAGQYGVGALRKGGKTAGYYNTVEASYGLQAGAHKFGYALFFMNDSVLENFEKSSGYELGSGPSITIVDEGLAKSLSTTTIKSDIYAFFFDQKGLMGGLGLRGTKITKIKPD